MRKIFNSRTENRWINILCVLACIAITLPLLILGKYNYPSADDWSFGASTYKTIQEGGNIFDVLREAFDVAMLWREKGEPRYANAFLGALQPGIWGEHFYCITPWIMIGSLIVSELILGAYLLRDCQRENRKWLLPIVLPTLMLQIMCVPYPVETFYWYTGSINYTFIFSLSLILLTLFLKLKEGGAGKLKTALMILLGSFIAVFVGGDSYAASLSAVCVFWAFSVLMLFKDKKALLRTLPITVITTVGLLICLIAPGNQVRLEQEFGGTTTGAVHAIVMSLARTGLNIYSWTTLKIIVMVLLIAPFLWKALKPVEYSFKYPLFFTLFTYGIYASQIVATMYVDGSTGGGRMADVLYYAYHMWVVLNVGYWIGWLQRCKKVTECQALQKCKTWISGHVMVWFMAMAVLLMAVLGATEIQQLSTYRACAWLFKGYATEYAEAWEERLEVLHDASVKEVYFDPLPGGVEMVYYADFQPGENWVNNACEVYYEKDYIGLK